MPKDELRDDMPNEELKDRIATERKHIADAQNELAKLSAIADVRGLTNVYEEVEDAIAAIDDTLNSLDAAGAYMPTDSATASASE